MANKKKKEKGKGVGQFKCGKCGNAFPKAHGLAIHIIRAHKRTWGKTSVSKPSFKPIPATKPVTVRKSVAVMVCPKCGRDTFRNTMSYVAHRRFCKGKAGVVAVSPAPTVLTPATYPAVRTLGSQFQPRTRTEAVHVASNGQNQIERLKAVAAGKRHEAEEIDKLVASFEENAQKFLK